MLINQSHQADQARPTACRSTARARRDARRRGAAPGGRLRGRRVVRRRPGPRPPPSSRPAAPAARTPSTTISADARFWWPSEYGRSWAAHEDGGGGTAVTAQTGRAEHARSSGYPAYKDKKKEEDAKTKEMDRGVGLGVAPIQTRTDPTGARSARSLRREGRRYGPVDSGIAIRRCVGSTRRPATGRPMKSEITHGVRTRAARESEDDARMGTEHCRRDDCRSNERVLGPRRRAQWIICLRF